MIDLFATEPHFVDHLAPIWHALPERGDFVAHRIVRERAEGHGIELGEGDPERAVMVASWGDYKRAVRMGYERIAYVEHGAGQSYGGDPATVDHPGYPGGRGHIGDGLYLVPNEYSAARWRAAYPRADVVVIGCAKLDTLPRKDPSGPTTVAISFHWPCGVSPETRTVFSRYRPHLPALGESFLAIGHAHPRWGNDTTVRQAYANAGIEWVDDFAEVCRRADVYACDNSSTIFEFAATRRPVVLLDGPTYRRDVHHGGRFWDWATVGVRCEDPTDLVAAVALALEDTPDQQVERERVVDLVYPYRDDSTARAVAAVMSWLGAVEVAHAA